jgi:hypothetical protein
MREISSEYYGSVTVSPDTPVIAGSFQSFEFVYTAGRYGIDDTGGIRLVFRFAADLSPPQFTDAKCDGYTTVTLPEGVEADVTWNNRGNLRPWYKTLQVQLTRGCLAEDDRITIRLGDKQAGGPGIRMQTFCETGFTFRFLVDVFSTQAYLPLPSSPKIDVVPGEPVTWKAVVPSLIKTGEPFRLRLKCEDKWGNPTDRTNAEVRLCAPLTVIGLPSKFTVQPGAFTTTIGNLRIEETGEAAVELLDQRGGLLARSNPMRVIPETDVHLYWADLHAQSGETVGTNTAEEFFAFARDRAFVDICGHQGNDFQISGDLWRRLQELNAAFHEPGRFLTVPGYEWSANTGLGGDRNVYYKTENRSIRRSSHALIPEEPDIDTDCPDAETLFSALAENREDAFVFAHAGGRYADLSKGHDGRFEHSVEIHSAWGTFEWLLTDAFEAGHRVGIVCNSDDHKGRPGAGYPGAALFGAPGGLTCFPLSRLTREHLFEAVRRRRHYGTTGARILLDVGLDFNDPAFVYPRDPNLERVSPTPTKTAHMGDIVGVRGRECHLWAQVVGTAHIERVDIFDGATHLETIHPCPAGPADRRIRIVWEGAEYRGRGRIVKWDGFLVVSDNRIERFQPINFYNPDHIPQKSGDEITWRSITAGNFAGLDLLLHSPDEGEIRFESLQGKFIVKIADITQIDTSFDLGGLGKRVRAYRVCDDNGSFRIALQRTLPIQKTGDTRLYLRVTQEDGHRAWSGPIYLFRENGAKPS